MGRNRRFFIVVGLAAVAACGVFLAGFLQDRSLARIQHSGVIRIGYAVEAPYAFLGADGQVTGESPEVAQVVVARLGIPRIEWIQIDFADLMDALVEDRVDVVAAGMFITPERLKRVAFSVPTFRVREGLLVPAGNPRKIHSYADAAKSPDFKMAVLRGSVEGDLLRQLGFSERQLMAVPDPRTGLEAVNVDMADGLALSTPTVHWMALQMNLGRTEPVQAVISSDPGEDQHRSYGAFAFRKQDRQLLEEWNRVLKSYVGSSDHRKLVVRFGFSESDMPDAREQMPQKAVP